MNTIVKSIITVTLFAVISSGCVSYQAIQHTKGKIALRRAIETNNEKAIKSFNDGKGYQDAGIPVTAWDAVKEEPLLHAGAGIADIFLVWGGAEGVKWMSDELKDDKPSNNRNTTVSVSNSENVNIEVNGDSTTTTTTTTTDNSDNSDRSESSQ